jgi:hypothetical protein
MVSFVPSVETILDERAKYAVLLVDAVEECTYMTILIDESTIEVLQRLRGGLHILTFSQREPRIKSAGVVFDRLRVIFLQTLSAGIVSLVVTSRRWLRCPGRP